MKGLLLSMGFTTGVFPILELEHAQYGGLGDPERHQALVPLSIAITHRVRPGSPTVAEAEERTAIEVVVTTVTRSRMETTGQHLLFISGRVITAQNISLDVRRALVACHIVILYGGSPNQECPFWVFEEAPEETVDQFIRKTNLFDRPRDPVPSEIVATTATAEKVSVS